MITRVSPERLTPHINRDRIAPLQAKVATTKAQPTTAPPMTQSPLRQEEIGGTNSSALPIFIEQLKVVRGAINLIDEKLGLKWQLKVNRPKGYPQLKFREALEEGKLYYQRFADRIEIIVLEKEQSRVLDSVLISNGQLASPRFPGLAITDKSCLSL